MNVYAVTTDSEIKLHLAESLVEAVEKDFELFLAENEGEEYATRDYYDTLLEQIVVVGELAVISRKGGGCAV